MLLETLRIMLSLQEVTKKFTFGMSGTMKRKNFIILHRFSSAVYYIHGILMQVVSCYAAIRAFRIKVFR